jgi:hypothetical protein
MAMGLLPFAPDFLIIQSEVLLFVLGVFEENSTAQSEQVPCRPEFQSQYLREM